MPSLSLKLKVIESPPSALDTALSPSMRPWTCLIARGGNTAKPTDVRRLDKGAVVVVPGFDGFEAHVGKDFIEVSYEGETARITNDKVDFS